MTIEIISGSTCPFAHRTRLLLMEKNVPYELTEIDLNDKPGWFLELSPYEKVPVLRHGDLVVFESAIVNEYLDEVFPAPPLMPQSPASRAHVRMWVDFANNRFIPPIYRLLMAQGPEEQARQAARLNEALTHMERRGLKADDGAAWFAGETLSLADCRFTLTWNASAPWRTTAASPWARSFPGYMPGCGAWPNVPRSRRCAPRNATMSRRGRSMPSTPARARRREICGTPEGPHRLDE
jgi:glutathione S-transferase